MAGMKRKTPAKSLSVAIAALGVELTAGAVPVDIRLIPAGEFRSWDGRPAECKAWVMTDEDGARIVAAAAAAGRAFVIDYEHATLKAKVTGNKAPAGGWYKQLEWRPGDGLWAIGVDWTALAAQHIADKEYRYISPVFSYDAKTGRVLQLFHASLTNEPALDGDTDLAALAADVFLTNEQESPVNEELLEQLRWLLNLPVGATAEDITAQLQKLIDQIKGTGVAAASFDLAAHLAAQAGEIAALSAKVGAPDPALFVPIATLQALQGEHASLQTQFAALSAEINGAKVDKAVADGLAAGKLTPATEAWARDLGKTNLAALTAYLDKAPVIVAPGKTQTEGQGVAGLSAQLTDVDRQVMKAMGLTAEQYAKGKQED